MKRYAVTLQQEERDELRQIIRKGSHSSQKVLNALILLNCDEGQFNEQRWCGADIASMLRISYRKADGEFEAHVVALSCSEPPSDYSQWSVRRVLKKLDPTVASHRVGDSAGGQCRVRGGDGGGSGCLPTPL